MGIRPGLGPFRRALAAAGHPEDDVAAVLIAGTNGKGSVSALLASSLQACGWRVGWYTSPHLISPRERIRLTGRPLPAKAWGDVQRLARRAARRARVRLTEFEELTLMAFLAFRGRVDLAVLEVGLGGRWDAVNAHPAPEVSVITSIGYDHQEWLGPRLSDIYREKRGVARPGTVLVEALPKSLWNLSEGLTREDGAWVWRLGRDFTVDSGAVNWEKGSQGFRVHVGSGRTVSLKSPLLGAHQRDNGALAFMVLQALSQRGWTLPSPLQRRGFCRAFWPGRFQMLRRRGPVILDGAHNREALAALLDTYQNSPWGRQAPGVIFGCLKDKPAESMARALSSVAARVWTVPLSSPRARSAESLAALFPRSRPAKAALSFAEAFRQADDGKRPLLITGSLYLVGEALRFFGANPLSSPEGDAFSGSPLP